MYRVVYVSYLLMVASAGVTFVFLEDVETLYGLPSWGIGLIAALGFVTAVFASLFIAPLGDRGFLSALGATAFIMAIAGNLWIGFADELWSIATSRTLASMGAGVFSVVGRKALIGETTDSGAEKVGGFISAAVAGFIAGPGLGAQLSEFGGIETPYLLIAALLAVLMLPTLKWLRETPVAVSERIRTRDMLPLLGRPGVRAAVACHVAIFFNIGVFDSTVDEYLTDLGASNQQVALILLSVGAPLLFIPRLAGRFVDNAARPAMVMLIATLVFVPIISTLALWVGLAVFVVFATLQTVTESVIFPSATRVVLDETGAHRSALGTGLVDAMGSAAGTVSAFIAPVLYDATDGPLGPFGMSASMALLLAVVAWRNIISRDEARIEARRVGL